MTVTLSALYVFLGLGALLQAPAEHGRLALVGLAAYAVGMASYAVLPGSRDPQVISAAARASGAAFFAVNTGLLVLGALLAAAAALGGLREQPRCPRAMALLAAAGFALWRLHALVAASGALRSAIAVATGAVGLALIGIPLRRLRRPSRPSGPVLDWAVLRGRPAISASFVVGALGVVLGPHTGLVFIGLMVAVAGDYLARRTHGDAAFPWLPVVTLGLLPIWWLLVTIAGPVGLGVASLRGVPLSPRAEILLALPLALVAWSCLGLWPAHRLFPGGLLAPLGVALWLRVARPALADGLDHWQPLLMPLGVLGVWGGGMSGRSSAAVNALAFVALTSAAGGSPDAALLLMAAALALAASRAPAASAPARRFAARLAWSVVILALPLLLEAGFRQQVTYTLAAAGGAAVAVWLGLAPGRDDSDATATGGGAVAA
jgi:hypothetical protein